MFSSASRQYTCHDTRYRQPRYPRRYWCLGSTTPTFLRKTVRLDLTFPAQWLWEERSVPAVGSVTFS